MSGIRFSCSPVTCPPNAALVAAGTDEAQLNAAVYLDRLFFAFLGGCHS